MDRGFCVLLVAFQLVPGLSLGEESVDPIPITGLVQKSVHLKCAPPGSDPPRVEWFDRVYNTDPNPFQIFDSNDNPERVIKPHHPNSLSYEVGKDANFTLTINELKLDSDPGEYFCHSWVNDTHYTVISYFVTVGDDPSCYSNQTELRVGDETYLSCESKYSGNNPPILRWFREEQLIASKDEFEIRLAKQTVHLIASHNDDKITYACVMQFGEKLEECTRRLSVTHPVRDVGFLPANRTHFYVGEQILCNARGNPAPKVTVEPVASKRLSNGSQLIDIGPSWKDKNVNLTIRCRASNTVDGRINRAETNITIVVTDRPAPSTTTGKPTPLPISKIDSNPGIVIGAILIVALTLLAIIGAVVLVRKHRDQQRRKAEAAKAEANRKKENQNQKNA